MKQAHFGFEIPSGDPVKIPINHTVITGQTQMAGKTTTLEALIGRSGVKAIVFVTKRGEGGFSAARFIPPYFREQADWQFVASILEASRGEKLKFERAWIIRASKGAKTLADVHRNVVKALETAKGLSADVYLTLEAYLLAVLPQINKVKWATSVELQPGVSAMDLANLNVEMQHLVIRSTLDWVLQHEEDTVVVIPEAWKFIPQGRGTPVKLGAEAYIRQAAALHNYLWLDSQDIAGVEKMILKSVPIWVLGVQRESNEVKRTLDQIPGGIKKPKADAVATLGLGQFYVCYGTTITKVYAQPLWMGQAEAVAIAEGRTTVSALMRPKEAQVNEREAKALREENADLKRRIADLERQVNMAGLDHRGRIEVEHAAKRVPPRVVATEPDPITDLVEDAIYQEIKRRLTNDAPGFIRVLAERPELEVVVQRPVITADGSSWLGRTAQLIADGFFDEPRKSSVVYAEAVRRGATGVAPRADEACKKLLAMGFLTREAEGFRVVPDMKVRVVEAA